MHFSLSTITTLLAFVTAAPANKGFVHAPMKKQTLPEVASKIPNFAASGPISADLYNTVLAYEVEISLGGQNVTASIDTGSEILWVWSEDSNACKVDPQDCLDKGTYTARRSASSQSLGKRFKITYGRGSASGYLFTDTAVIGGATAPGFKFGVNSGDISSGGFSMVFGIGVNSDAQSSISAQLQKAGEISRNLYGMSFSDPADTGTSKDNSEVTFGAINTGRYSGSLKTVSRIRTRGLQHFSIYASGKIGDTVLFDKDLVILDSGTTMTMLKTAYYKKLLGVFADAGISLDDYGSGWQGYPCSLNSKINFAYNFSGKEITVSGDDMAIPAHLLSAKIDESVCFMGVVDGGTLNIFGDTFLRSAYTVYDLERDEISLAQAAYGNPDNYQVVTGSVPN